MYKKINNVSIQNNFLQNKCHSINEKKNYVQNDFYNIHGYQVAI